MLSHLEIKLEIRDLIPGRNSGRLQEDQHLRRAAEEAGAGYSGNDSGVNPVNCPGMIKKSGSMFKLIKGLILQTLVNLRFNSYAIILAFTFSQTYECS